MSAPRPLVASAWIAAAVWLLSLWLIAQPPLALQHTAERLGDAVWAHTASRQSEQRLILIDIDDRSLQALGPWPWPRDRLAQLSQRLAELGVQQQIFDIVFADPAPAGQTNARLAEAIHTHQVVLAQVFATDPASIPADRPLASGELGGALDWPSCIPPFESALGYIANQPELTAQTPFIGHITPSLAADGIVRHQPAVLCWQQRAYPALALAAGLSASAAPTLQPRPGSWWQAPWQLHSTTQSLPPLPLDHQGRLRIGWLRHPDSFTSLSAVDVLTGQIPPDKLRGTWALIGSSAFGLNDSIATPFGPTAAGMLAHAQIITAWLDQQTPYTPRAAPAIQATLGGIGIGLLLLLLLRRSPSSSPSPAVPERFGRLRAALWLPGAGLGLAALILALFALALRRWGLWISPLEPALAIVLASLLLAAQHHWHTLRERQRLYQHLRSYLPAPLAATLSGQDPSGHVLAQQRHVVVWFADIRNFSAYCEARPPAEAAAVLHAFFSAAARTVQAHGGVIESFQGDAILAVWNADETTPAHTPLTTSAAFSALRAARQLLGESATFLPSALPEGLEPLQLGIGIEAGLATVGSFGPAHRRTHLVMGRTVTVANRLVGMTADLAHPILLGEGIATHIGSQLSPSFDPPSADTTSQTPTIQSLGTFLLDGLRVPHHIYAIPLHQLPVFCPPAEPSSPSPPPGVPFGAPPVPADTAA